MSTKQAFSSWTTRLRRPRYLMGAVAAAMLLAGVVLDADRDRRHVSVGKLAVPSTCGFRLLTGIPCPSCGLTRSVTLTVHGRIRTAVAMHPMGPLVAGAAALQAVFALLSLASPRLDGYGISPNAVGYGYGALFFVVLTAGVLRWLGYFGWPPL